MIPGVAFVAGMAVGAAALPLLPAVVAGKATGEATPEVQGAGAGYDFTTGETTSGSGAVVTVDWPDAVLLEKGRTYTYTMTVSYTDQAVTESTGVGFGGIRFTLQGGNEANAGIPEVNPSALFLLSVVFIVFRRRWVACA